MMNGPREPKKSETIEVRLHHKAKSALMNRARAEGRSAIEVIRQSIDSREDEGLSRSALMDGATPIFGARDASVPRSSCSRRQMVAALGSLA
jgi:hypothetical protein